MMNIINAFMSMFYDAALICTTVIVVALVKQMLRESTTEVSQINH